MSDRILCIGDDGVRTPDASFIARLKAFDKDLCVAWNTRKNRWAIEQCTEHHPVNGEHSHLCKRVLAWLCQDEDGDMVPLGDFVMAKLAEMRTFSEQFGEGPQSLERFKRFVNNQEAEMRAKREAAVADINDHNRKFNKRQFEHVRHLMQQHDMRPNR